MPNIKSAIKRVKVNEKANIANSQAKSAMRTTVKKLKTLFFANAENKQELLQATFKSLDKATSKGLIHKTRRLVKVSPC